MASTSTTSIGSKRSYDDVWLSWSDVFDKAGVAVAADPNTMTLPLHSFIYIDRSNRKSYLKFILGTIHVVLQDEDLDAILDACNSIEEDPSSAKRRHVERNVAAPSEIAKIDGWRSFLGKASGHLVCNHRPGHGFPVTLQVEAFGKFVDALEVGADVYYRRMALELMLAMSKLYSTEGGRQEALQGIFQNNGFYFTNVGNQELKCDLTIKNSSQDRVLANFELKAELGYDGKNPNWQNVAYFIHLTKNQGQLRRNPMLLISISGCDYLQVFGATWHGGCVCVDPLSGPLSLLYVPDNTENIEALARVLSAMRAALNDLDSYNEVDSSHPYFTDRSNLTYLSQVANYLFRAWYSDGLSAKNVVVKFVKRYGLEVHAFLADWKLAPKLHKVEKLPGGWMAVVMDEVKGTNLTDVAKDKLVEAGYETFRTTLEEKLQEKGFVHGDLRRQNILLSDTNNFIVIDFDWAGKCGHVKYPLTINTSSNCDWAPDVAPDGLIKSSHDQYQLHQHA